VLRPKEPVGSAYRLTETGAHENDPPPAAVAVEPLPIRLISNDQLRERHAAVEPEVWGPEVMHGSLAGHDAMKDQREVRRRCDRQDMHMP
jgi:hypothetical protein